MPIRLVTFDCANTLLKGSWDPVGFALWAAREAGLCLPARAGAEYETLLRRYYGDILAANRTGDYATVQRAYTELGESWLSGLNVVPSLASEIVAASAKLLFEPDSGLFETFDDVVPVLEALRARKVHVAVVSNWDASLEGVLVAHGLRDLVDDVYASLVVGAEKPDPTMLNLAIDSADCLPEETLHVGDDETDDLGAAHAAGVRCLLIDRSASDERPGVIRSLQEVLRWID